MKTKQKTTEKTKKDEQQGCLQTIQVNSGAREG
jgi:hypothetical protein